MRADALCDTASASLQVSEVAKEGSIRSVCSLALKPSMAGRLHIDADSYRLKEAKELTAARSTRRSKTAAS